MSAEPGPGRSREAVTPSVSVVIPNLDSTVVDRAIRAILAQRGARADEILIVGRDRPGRLAPFLDPGSDRGSVDGIPVRRVETDGPRLPGAARNLGVAESRGEIIAFTDADCVPEPGWLAAHLARQAAGERVVGGAVRYDRDNYWSLADNLSMFHECDPALPAGRRAYLPTLNLSVSRAAFLAAGPMDPDLPSGEDLDWTIRAAAAGYPPFFEPAALLWHRPTRTDVRAVWDHWYRSGRWMPGVRRRHADVLDAPGWLRFPALVLLLTPAIATVATLRLFGPGKPGRRHWRTLPAVFLTKLAWCMGACRQRDVPAQGPSSPS